MSFTTVSTLIVVKCSKIFVLCRRMWKVAGFGNRVESWSRGIVGISPWRATTSTITLPTMTVRVANRRLVQSSCLETTLSRFRSLPSRPKNSSLKSRQVFFCGRFFYHCEFSVEVVFLFTTCECTVLMLSVACACMFVGLYELWVLKALT